MEDKFLSSESILSQTSLCLHFASWKMYLFSSKKIAFMSSTEMIIPFRKFLRLRHEKNVFCGINFCDVGILWKKMQNLFSRSQCFKKNFSTKSEKDTIYMGIIYMSFLSRNLLCKNIYTMSSFMWSNELFSILKWWLYLYCIFLFSFLTYEVSYSKNIISETIYDHKNFCP